MVLRQAADNKSHRRYRSWYTTFDQYRESHVEVHNPLMLSSLTRYLFTLAGCSNLTGGGHHQLQAGVYKSRISIFYSAGRCEPKQEQAQERILTIHLNYLLHLSSFTSPKPGK